MNIEWLKNKSKEKFYPITNAKAVLYDSNKTVAEEIADVEKQVTTNLLKPTLETTTVNGVTCTNNGDGTYTLNGTATSQPIFFLNENVNVIGSNLKLVGCPPNVISDSQGYLQIMYDNNEWGESEIGDGVAINSGKNILKVVFTLKAGYTVNNLVIKPMITTNLNATYDDFVPFTGTTGKLNGDVAELEKSNEGKMDKENPTGTGSFSMNRKVGTKVGNNSTTEGAYNTASGANSHAEGAYNTASGANSHAEGESNEARGASSHAEGESNTASGKSSHAEGESNTASGANSHAEGSECMALGSYAHSGGLGTRAGYKSQTSIGEYNENKEEDIFEVGNGTPDTRSNALELTKNGDLTIAGGLLDTVISMIVDHIYEGVDLTVKFASEIANYSDEWAWIKSRVTDGNYSGIHVGDYIPITCSNGYVLNAQVAGINTYTGSEYMDEYTGNTINIVNHIDFICKELWNNFHAMNKVAYNNGNGNNLNPFIASDLNYWLNSMSGTVPNSVSDPSVTTSVDYTAGGVLYYLPDKLKNQIITKNILLPSRYTAGSVLTADNSWAWQSTGKLWIPSEVEIYGTSIFGCARYSCGFVQYPLFAYNMNTVKRLCTGGEIADWWLLSSVDGYSTQFVAFSRDICGLSYLNANNSYAAAPVCFRI